MLTALYVVLWVAAAILAVVIAACLTPLRLEVAVRKKPDWQLKMNLRPFGRFGPEIPLRRPRSKPRPYRPRPKKERGKRPSLQRIVTNAIRLLSDVLASIRFEGLRCNCRYGFDDPAETGSVYGMLAPIIQTSSPSSRLQLDVQPEFERAVFELEANAAISLVPARLVMPLLRFGWLTFGPQR